MLEPRIPKCFICLDNGFVLYQKVLGGMQGEYVSHCTCMAGGDYSYDGRKSQKNKSPYRVPSVYEVIDAERLAVENYRAWWRNNRGKDGVRAALEKRGIPVPKEDIKP